MRRSTFWAFAFAVTLLGPGLAQSRDTYDLSWYTIDGGGAMWSVGGGYEISGTIGQPDAGAVMTGGSFALTGGFWPAGQVVHEPGDCDGDGFVDLDDFGVFAGCMAGPMASVSPECRCADLDDDGDAELADFAELQRVFAGP